MSRATLHDSLSLELMDDVPVARLLSTQRVFDRAVERVAELIRETVAKGHPHLFLDVRDAAFEADRARLGRSDAAIRRHRPVVSPVATIPAR